MRPKTAAVWDVGVCTRDRGGRVSVVLVGTILVVVVELVDGAVPLPVVSWDVAEFFQTLPVVSAGDVDAVETVAAFSDTLLDTEVE